MLQQQDNQIRYFYPVRPNNERKMTDVGCIIIYCMLSLVVLGAFFYSFILEKESNFLKPRDPSGRNCGYGQASNYPYIYFPAPFPESISRAVCVSKCPRDQNQKINCLKNALVQNCEYDITDHFNRSNQFIVYSTKQNSFLSLCQPESRILLDVLNSKINTQHLYRNLEYIYQADYIIKYVCPGVSLALILTYLLLINLCKNVTPLFSIMTIIFFLAAYALGALMFTQKARQILTFFPIVGIVTLALTTGFLLWLVSNFQNFVKALELLDIGAIYIRENRRLVFMSILVFIIWGFMFATELLFVAFIYAIDSDQSNSSSYKFPYMINFNKSLPITILLFLTLIHYIWTTLIIHHAGKFISRAGSANWILHVPHQFKNALYILFKFHLGSIMLGAVLIPMLSWITSFFYFILPDSNNRLCCCTMTSLSKFYNTTFFQRWLGFYTQLTYVKVALDGQNFCKAGQQLTPVIVSNAKVVARSYSLAKMIVQMSKAAMIILSTAICCFVVQLADGVENHIVTTLIFFIFSWLLVSFSFNSYDRSFETILLTIFINSTQKKEIVERVGIAHFASQASPDAQTRLRVYDAIYRWHEKEREKSYTDKRCEDTPLQK